MKRGCERLFSRVFRGVVRPNSVTRITLVGGGLPVCRPALFGGGGVLLRRQAKVYREPWDRRSTLPSSRPWVLRQYPAEKGPIRAVLVLARGRGQVAVQVRRTFTPRVSLPCPPTMASPMITNRCDARADSISPFIRRPVGSQYQRDDPRAPPRTRRAPRVQAAPAR